jgi:hypothetical protein
MDKELVFEWECYDAASDEMVKSKRLATPEGVSRAGGRCIVGTDRYIDSALLIYPPENPVFTEKAYL